jgi:dolichyl-phosphate beta-glucosyltransferase
MKISLIIPAYNESGKIARDIEAVARFAEQHRDHEWEVLIVDDGSRDRTTAEAQIAADRVGGASFRVLRYDRNRGKGYAVRYGVERAEGKVIGFVDAGLCVPFHHIFDALAVLKDHDVAIASRRLAKARIRQAQPMHRRIGSQVFGKLVRRFMGIRVSDTQCGFKFYRARAAKAIFGRVRTDGFMFDIEALLVARRLGLKIGEFAVEWSNDSDTRYNPITGTVRNFRELLQIRLRTLRA